MYSSKEPYRHNPSVAKLTKVVSVPQANIHLVSHRIWWHWEQRKEGRTKVCFVPKGHPALGSLSLFNL